MTLLTRYEETFPLDRDHGTNFLLAQIDQSNIARQSGYLRGTDDPLIAANDDVEAVESWLTEYEKGDYSRQTLASARKESMRLVLWAAIEREKPLSDLTRDDMVAYRSFLMDPQPAHRWQGPKHPRSHDEWRPFEGPLSPNSARQALVVLNGLFVYLMDSAYIRGNPMARMLRHNRSATQKQKGRDTYLTPSMWQAVTNYIDTWPVTTPYQVYLYERARFLLLILISTGARLSDIRTHQMGDFICLKNSDGTHGWWWRMLGKGSKQADIPVPIKTMKALGRWRTHLKLPARPEQNEARPLIAPFGKLDAKSVGQTTLYRVIIEAFRNTADRIESSAPEDAAKLRQASPHWLRHTAISRLNQFLSNSAVRDLARHSDIKTTSRYIHTEDAELFHSVQQDNVDW